VVVVGRRMELVRSVSEKEGEVGGKRRRRRGRGSLGHPNVVDRPNHLLLPMKSCNSNSVPLPRAKTS